MASDGMNYAPAPMPKPVVEPGDFTFSVVGLDHGHIFGMTEGLLGAGATLKSVYDPDPAKLEAFKGLFPDVEVARAEEEILGDDAVQLVAGAAVTADRAPLGLRVMEAGKDYFTDKAPLTTLEQLAAVRETTARTGQKYAVYYSERIHVEAAVMAGQLIEQDAIGRVIQVMGMGPHRLNAPSRPDWFFDKERYGGILCDIGSHNFEQMLYFTGAKDATVTDSNIANYAHPEYPGLDDFGDAHIVMDNGASGYVRVDWFTPDGLSTWGDGRTFILGTEGYIELRKYANITTGEGPGHVFLVDGKGEHHFNATGKVGYPFFGQLVLDSLNRTENAMTQEHALKAAELSVQAQLQARDLTPRG
ncbi:Gfo/Idh/MocA family oxidoreductase [Propioniciclava coleopterorum]|uniref:Gfo/Idh/MocA family oxidoreductase n=1 Tax=Propioniciclava coleopterorum TaxID=2714937 RepID=A0A6G7Y7D1_9ACTN|nr:Gfo/Idh/MocA family oxidoreductase [Propioniciclava coleopterorum]QIK72619.1 Gfo/Idh/MocA family oxidoreductase [Propioniciclava coleopterorum]